MKTIKLYILSIGLFLISCSDSYEQQYRNFEEFNKTNQRNKSWFPSIISTDVYDLKNTSYLDPLCAFGKFSYKNEYFYDSLFNSKSTNKIDINEFESKINSNLKRRPNWFLKPTNLEKNEFTIIQIERFYLARQKNFKQIYFVLTN